MNHLVSWIPFTWPLLAFASLALPGVQGLQHKPVFEGKFSQINDVAISRDGKMVVVSEGLEGRVRLRRLAWGTNWIRLDNCERVFGIDFSPDGRSLVAVDQDNIVSVWEVASGKKRATLK